MRHRFFRWWNLCSIPRKLQTDKYQMKWSYKEVLNPKKPEKVLSQSTDCKQYLGYSTHKVRVHRTVKFGPDFYGQRHHQKIYQGSAPEFQKPMDARTSFPENSDKRTRPYNIGPDLKTTRTNFGPTVRASIFADRFISKTRKFYSKNLWRSTVFDIRPTASHVPYALVR